MLFQYAILFSLFFVSLTKAETLPYEPMMVETFNSATISPQWKGQLVPFHIFGSKEIGYQLTGNDGSVRYLYRDRSGAPTEERVTVSANFRSGGDLYVGIGEVGRGNYAAGVRISCLKGSRAFNCAAATVTGPLASPNTAGEMQFAPITYSQGSGSNKVFRMEGAFEFFVRRSTAGENTSILIAIVQGGQVVANLEQQVPRAIIANSYRLLVGLNPLKFRGQFAPTLAPPVVTDYPALSGNLTIDYVGTDVLESSSPRLPFYRSYNPFSGAHFFTTSFGEHLIACNNGHSPEGVAFHGLRTKVTGATELYRVFNYQKGYHYYTTDKGEKDYLVSLTPRVANPTIGWRDEGTVGFVYPPKKGLGAPIYRLYNRDSGAHLFTTMLDYAETIVKLFPNSWRIENDLGEAPR